MTVIFKYISILILIITLICFKSTEQKKIFENQQEQTCFKGNDDLLMDPLTSISNSFIRDTFLKAFDEAKILEMLPKEISSKFKDKDGNISGNFKRKIETILDEEIDKKINEGIDAKIKPFNDSDTEKIIPKVKTDYKPYGGEARITNWSDLYHYFPHLSTKIRLWKLEFKASAIKNLKKFKGCANPMVMVDWLVPDFEQVKIYDQKHNGNKSK